MRLCNQAWAECVFLSGQVFCFVQLPEALLASPGADHVVLVGDEAHSCQPLQRWIDPTIHGDVGRADGVGIDIVA